MSIIRKVKFMKSQKKSRTLNVITSVFNVRQWSDYDRMKTFSQYLGQMIRHTLIPNKVEIKKSEEYFLEKVAAMNLTEADLEARKKRFYILSILMCVIALGVFGYSIYHMVHGNLKAVVVSVVVTMIALVLAFRYHYWYFQIKIRKLGCTFGEWFRRGLLGR
jgi:intracellular multiplication protein IcmV